MKTKVTLKFAIGCILGALALFFIARPIFSMLMTGNVFLAIVLFAFIAFVLFSIFKFISKYLITEEMSKLAQWHAARYGGFWVFTAMKLKNDKKFFKDIRQLMVHEDLLEKGLIADYDILSKAVASEDALAIALINSTFSRSFAHYVAVTGKSVREAYDELVQIGPEKFTELYPPLLTGTTKTKK